MTKILLIVLNKSHAIWVITTRGIEWKKKSTNISSSFDYIVYALSDATKMQLFWSLLNANDVSPCISIFNYLKSNYYYYYYYFEIIWNVQFKCFVDLILWHMSQCKYVMWHFEINLNTKYEYYVGRYINRCSQT